MRHGTEWTKLKQDRDRIEEVGPQHFAGFFAAIYMANVCASVSFNVAHGQVL